MRRSKYHSRWRSPALLALVMAALSAPGLSAAPDALALVQLSADPYTNSTSQHYTQVEPDSFSDSATIVATFQSGRFSGAGASNIGWATTHDGGASWTSGFLPGITVYAGGPYVSVSDPSVAYSARDNAWLISSLIPYGAVVSSRSLDGGTVWSLPVTVASGGFSIRTGPSATTHPAAHTTVAAIPSGVVPVAYA